MTQSGFSGAFASLVLAALALTPVSYGQSAPAAQAAVPVTMTECEGTNNCATWTFLGAQGNGQWPSGEVANLNVDRYDTDSVVIRRADSTGFSAGLTAVYTGTRHDDRVGGEFISSWPGHWDNKSGNWYATVEKPINPPLVIHFCAANCATLKWETGRYVGERQEGTPPGFTSIWTIESFTRESVILHRHDSPNPANPSGLNGWDVVYTGQMSKEGNSLINATINGKPSPNFKLSWGTALNSTPGTNAERDHVQQSQKSPQQQQQPVVVPVICIPWFFTVICQ